MPTTSQSPVSCSMRAMLPPHIPPTPAMSATFLAIIRSCGICRRFNDPSPDRSVAPHACRDTFAPARCAHLRYPPLMPSLAPEIATAPRTVRLKTLIALRWFAVIGQAVSVLAVQYVLEFELPLATCLAVIALSAWLNVAMSMHFRNVQRLAPGPGAGRFAH